LLLEIGKRYDACVDLNNALTNGHPKALDPMKYTCPEFFN
jgi:hypothetical protein